MPAKLILGYIVRNEYDTLRVTLPKLFHFVDGIEAVDAMSEDGTVRFLHEHNARVLIRPWNNSYADARNACIAIAESRWPSSAWMIMLDADECVTARDMMALRPAIDDGSAEAFAFPRYEFVDDFFHFNPLFYPDLQARAFKLHSGFGYKGTVHEQLVFQNESKTAFESGRCVMLPYVHIFHYSKAQPKQKMWLKYENYRRINAKESLLKTVPHGVEFPDSYSHGPKLVFHGERPL